MGIDAADTPAQPAVESYESHPSQKRAPDAAPDGAEAGHPGGRRL